MPRILWSLSAAPRFNVREKICGRYKVQKVVKEDKVSQLVHVKSKGDESVRVVRILTRASVKEKDVMDEIEWIRNTCISREEFPRYLEYHTDMRYFYVVFDKSKRTLRDIINDVAIHLSRRHIVEILTQIVRAVRHLNHYFIFDVDICPENIEVLDDDVPEWFYCHRTEGFKSRKALVSTRLRFAYHGRFGCQSSKHVVSEPYKSPEHVYDMPITGSSNVFSVGCVLAELLTRKPLFPPCPPGPLYTREKSVVYDAILGPFPDDMIQDIRRSFRGVFRYSNSDFPETVGISSAIQEFCERSEPLRYTILEEFSGDIVQCMTHLDSRHRVPLRDILFHPFMDVSSL